MRAKLTSAVIAAFALAGCQADAVPVATGPEPADEQESTVDSPEPEAPPAEFLPELDAAANLPYFEEVLAASGAGVDRVEGAAVVTALEEAGFQPEAIDITPDMSLIALPADSVSVAVEFKGECLLGQYTTSWLAVDLAPLLPDGSCLVHETESLD